MMNKKDLKKRNIPGMGTFPCAHMKALSCEEAAKLLAEMGLLPEGCHCEMWEADGTDDGREEKCGIGADPEKGFEGDGEEVFGEMLDDLLYMASLIDTLFSTVYYLSENRMRGDCAVERATALMMEADEVLEKWQRYSMPEG